MPSGYTAILEKKQPTLAEFALQCARNFGALILMRDDPWDKPIPVFEPHLINHEKALASLRKEREELTSITDEQLHKKMLDLYVLDLADTDRRNKEAFENYKRATALEAEIMMWEPPTKDHVELKNFMLEQVREFIRWDAHSSRAPEPPLLQSRREERLASITEEVRYHEEEIKAEIARTDKRNDWVKVLRESLK